MQKKQFATVPLEAVRLESERAMLSEELRVLYVAMTRAKERLIVTAALKKAGEQLDGYDADARSGPLSPAEVREGHDYASWILMALARQGSLSSALRFEKPVAGVRLSLGFLEEKRQAGSPQEAQLSLFEKQAPPPAEADEALAEELVRRAAFSYPCGKAAQTPAKLAVSALTHPQGGENRFLAAPAFLGRGTPGSERGSAAHAFMQYCDYRRLPPILPPSFPACGSRESSARGRRIWLTSGRSRRFSKAALPNGFFPPGGSCGSLPLWFRRNAVPPRAGLRQERGNPPCCRESQTASFLRRIPRC